jgi:hypothetical protein
MLPVPLRETALFKEQTREESKGFSDMPKLIRDETVGESSGCLTPVAHEGG